MAASRFPLPVPHLRWGKTGNKPRGCFPTFPGNITHSVTCPNDPRLSVFPDRLRKRSSGVFPDLFPGLDVLCPTEPNGFGDDLLPSALALDCLECLLRRPYGRIHR